MTVKHHSIVLFGWNNRIENHLGTIFHRMCWITDTEAAAAFLKFNGSVEEEFQEQQANHHNRILLWIVMLPKSFVPRISNTRETELEMICEYSSRKCRWSRVLRGGANEAGRGVGRQRIVAEDFLGIWRDSLFVFNIKINESKQNNKSTEKLNCNDVVLPSSTSRSTRPTRRTLSRRRYIRGSVSTRWLPEGGRHRKRWLHVGSER